MKEQAGAPKETQTEASQTPPPVPSLQGQLLEGEEEVIFASILRRPLGPAGALGSVPGHGEDGGVSCAVKEAIHIFS